ncbi:MAG TPA: protein kinase [Vicinamibacteria bacterium]|nr:protein kinase [Vicinamibacteria bacterium]
MASEPPVRREADARRTRKDGREPPARPGDRVAHYEILAELGRGGMGVVYRARDARLERDVALKCPWPDLASNPTVRERFTREARAAARLSDPHIVPVFEVLEHQGLPWLAMELIEGSSLRALLHERGALPVEKIVRFAEGLGHALRTAHAKQILHRDLTPNNVLVNADGWAFLTDFGLARALASDGAESSATTESEPLTGHGQIVGTRCYMSPEQVLGRNLDARSDVFSFGAVLYEMCTGQRAFADTEPGGASDAILRREPAAISQLNPRVPPELARIVSKALAKHPDDRYHDMSSMHADIVACRRAVESAESRPALAASHRLLGGAAWALGVLGALAVGALGWRVLTRRPSDVAFELGTPRQLTSDPGWEAEPALSPDGSLLAYTSNASGSPDIWILDVRSGGRVQLTQDPAADHSPAWLPDGSAVLLESDRGGQPGIWKVARLGGSALPVVADAARPAASPDGRLVAFSRAGASGFHRIMVAPLADPARGRWLTSDADGRLDHTDPVWSPDGNSLCYADARNLWLVGVDGGEPHRLTDDAAKDFAPVFSSSGRHVIFSSLREGTRALWRVSVAGGAVQRLTAGAGPEGDASISADGTRLAYSTFLKDFDVALVDLGTGRSERVESLMEESAPAFAPDGSSFVYTSEQGAAGVELWRQELVAGRISGRPHRLTEQLVVGTPAFSPDGEWVAFTREHEGRREIWTLKASGGLPERFSDGPADFHPAFAPDGSRLAYVAATGAALHLWVVTVANGKRTGPPRRLTSGPTSATLPVWSPDSRHVAYVGARGSRQDIWIIPADGSAPPRPIAAGSSLGRLRWLGSGGWLWFGSDVGGRARFLKVKPEAGQPLPALNEAWIEDAWTPGDFDVSRDGSLLVFTREEKRGDLWLLDAGKRVY